MQNQQVIPLIIIGGPTAVGKTALSIQLAQQFDGEVVNGDALQVYQGLNIGTGKIKVSEMDGVVHHLLDIIPPDHAFNAYQFKQVARQTIKEIYQRGKLPILVGGTGLYLQGLMEDLAFGGINQPLEEERLAFQQQYHSYDNQALWQVLQATDPQAAKQIPFQNRQRILRALEVATFSGVLFSKQGMNGTPYHTCLICLNRPRADLYERINQRVEQMVMDGLEAEVHHLYQLCPKGDWPALKGIGYKEWWPYFSGEQTREEVIANIQQNSRRYAKRQLTWFRNRFNNVHWVEWHEQMDDVAMMQTVTKLVESHLKGASQ